MDGVWGVGCGMGCGMLDAEMEDGCRAVADDNPEN